MSQELPSSSPIYGISITPEEVKALISTSLPDATFISSSEFPPGSSYNNKLYNVVVSDDGTNKRELVLRLCGRFWKHHKTLNEIACMKLLRKARALPVPTVLAYSTTEGKEWILMDKLEGVNLSSAMKAGELSQKDHQDVARDLASILYKFRRDMTRDDGMMGNLSGYNEETGEVAWGPYIDGPSAKGWPWKGYTAYTRALLEDACHSLETTETLEPNRYLLPKVRSFMESKLPSLPVFSDPTFNSSVLNHGDLSPRNILVSRDASRMSISGLVDFEWMGFFPFNAEYVPSEEEAFNENKDDCMNKMLLDEMEKMGLPTKRTVDQVLWKQAEDLSALRMYLAPWWLMQVEKGNERLPKELPEAAKTVVEILERLAAVAQ